MNRKHAGFSLLQEAMLFYYYLEYLARYAVKIAPNFYKKKIIVADRYFYDMFAHYSYASKSVLFKKLLRMFPSPDFTFFLDIDAKTAKKRKPEMDIDLIKMHRSRYLALSKIMKLEVINTRKGIGKCLESVMRITESRIAKMLK